MTTTKDRANVFSRTRLSDCAHCPFNAQRRVPGGSYLARPGKVAFVGEAPGADEERRGVPFVGAAGDKLRDLTGRAGFTWAELYQANVVNCRPPMNRIREPHAQVAIRRCASGFQAELEYAVSQGVRVFVALGQTALTAFDVTSGSISKTRGSVYEKVVGGEVVYVVPTYHPSYLLRGKDDHRETSIVVTDLMRARDVALHGWNPPPKNYVTGPSLGELEEFVLKAESANEPLIAGDIETARRADGTSYTKMIGFALDESHALCVPVTSKGAVQYWSEEEKPLVHALVQRLLALPTMWQNVLFDVPRLQADGYEVSNILHDTMLAHHALYSELPHTLDYISSVYGKQPYWKDMRRMSWKNAEAMEDEDFWNYNLDDCVALHQILPGLLEEIEENNVWWAYRRNMELVPIAMELEKNGLFVDKAYLKAYAERLEVEASRQLVRVVSFDVSPDLNLRSTQDKTYLFYGKKPEKYYRAQVTVKNDARKSEERLEKARDVVRTSRPTTKKYAKAKAIVDGVDVKAPTQKNLDAQSTLRAVENTTPLRLPAGYKPLGSTDDEAVDSMRRAVANRLEALGRITRKTEAHEEETRALERSHSVIDIYATYQKIATQFGLYTKMPIADDGRVHGSYVIHGTATGRLSSRNPNMQNITKEAKKMFVAPEGRALIEGDYKALELRVLAEISDDDVLRDIFARGVDVHSENTKTLFGIEEHAALWDEARRAAKTYIFGRNYGGGLSGIFGRVSRAVPELRLGFQTFREADARYREKHPAYEAWKKALFAELASTRTLTNAFGRRRVFLGTESEIKREGLNFPIQSTAADILNEALVRLHAVRPAWMKLVMTVHDSIVVEVPLAKTAEGARLLRRVMEEPLTIANRLVTFPADIAAGARLGALEGVAA